MDFTKKEACKGSEEKVCLKRRGSEDHQKQSHEKQSHQKLSTRSGRHQKLEIIRRWRSSEAQDWS